MYLIKYLPRKIFIFKFEKTQSKKLSQGLSQSTKIFMRIFFDDLPEQFCNTLFIHYDLFLLDIAILILPRLS